MWDCIRSGIQPVSPAIAGRFFTTESPGKPWGCQSLILSWAHTSWDVCVIGSFKKFIWRHLSKVILPPPPAHHLNHLPGAKSHWVMWKLLLLLLSDLPTEITSSPGPETCAPSVMLTHCCCWVASVPTLCDPMDCSPPGSRSLGFSRQEHWSGLPFPSPMRESEKWKWSRSVMSDSSDPMDCSPPGSSIHGVSQARVLEWGAISFSNAWKWKVKVKSLSRARLFATPWTAVYQAPPSMGFPRQEYWSGVPLPSPMLTHTES